MSFHGRRALRRVTRAVSKPVERATKAVTSHPLQSLKRGFVYLNPITASATIAARGAGVQQDRAEDAAAIGEVAVPAALGGYELAIGAAGTGAAGAGSSGVLAELKKYFASPAAHASHTAQGAGVGPLDQSGDDFNWNNAAPFLVLAAIGAAVALVAA